LPPISQTKRPRRGRGLRDPNKTPISTLPGRIPLFAPSFGEAELASPSYEIDPTPRYPPAAWAVVANSRTASLTPPPVPRSSDPCIFINALATSTRSPRRLRSKIFSLCRTTTREPLPRTRPVITDSQNTSNSNTDNPHFDRTRSRCAAAGSDPRPSLSGFPTPTFSLIFEAGRRHRNWPDYLCRGSRLKVPLPSNSLTSTRLVEGVTIPCAG